MKQLTEWRQDGLQIPISVNIGATQLLEECFLPCLRAAFLVHPDVPPALLELEILETSALADFTKASKIMRSCLDLGVGFAIDDFGTGYSSLSYLRHLPAGLVKIDQSFVRDMLEDENDLALIHGIVVLAQAFRRNVIAEGVETTAHGEALLRIGCDYGQGYGIARPMPAVGFTFNLDSNAFRQL